jgi:hypothetical protein
MSGLLGLEPGDADQRGSPQLEDANDGIAAEHDPTIPSHATLYQTWWHLEPNDANPLGFKDPAHLAVLLKYLNNQPLRRGIMQMFCVCERDHVLLRSMKGFIGLDTALNLYIKTLQQNIFLASEPVFIDGIDI